MFQSASIKIRIKDGGDNVGQRYFVNACHRGSANLVGFVGMLHEKLLDLSVPIDLEAYVSLGHALVTLRDDLRGCLADALLRSNAELNVVAASSNFLAILSITSQAPVLATLPSRMAQKYAPGFGLTVSPVPLKMQVAPVAMVWSARADREPGAAWLRAQIRQILAGYAKPADKVLNGYHQAPKARVRTSVLKKKG